MGSHSLRPEFLVPIKNGTYWLARSLTWLQTRSRDEQQPESRLRAIDGVTVYARWDESGTPSILDAIGTDEANITAIADCLCAGIWSHAAAYGSIRKDLLHVQRNVGRPRRSTG